MIFSMNAVQEYFQTHLERQIWQNFPGDMQSAAVETAKADVQSALQVDSLDLNDLLIFSAVCEQALYAAKCTAAERSSSDSDARLKSETVDGVGKREYYQKSAVEITKYTGELAPRAALFLARHPVFRTLDFSRG